MNENFEFDSQMNAYIEANYDYAKKLFDLAKDHKMTYMIFRTTRKSIQ